MQAGEGVFLSSLATAGDFLTTVDESRRYSTTGLPFLSTTCLGCLLAARVTTPSWAAWRHRASRAYVKASRVVCNFCFAQVAMLRLQRFTISSMTF